MQKERMKGRQKERKKERKKEERNKRIQKNAHQINVLKVAFPFSVR